MGVIVDKALEKVVYCRQEKLEKGKPAERQGRKAMDLKQRKNCQDSQVAGHFYLNPANFEKYKEKRCKMFKDKRWICLLLTLVMVFAFTVPVFAQEEVEPVEEPAVVEEPSKFLDHPIVKLLAEFFADFFSPPAEEEPEPLAGGEDPVGDPPEEGSTTEEEELEPEVVPEEKVASMHEEDKLGFGEIVKLTDLAKSAQEQCSDTCEFCEVTLDSLIEEYKSGHGMGALFTKYGKPDHMGFGQVRKELDPKDKEKTNNGKPKNK